MAKLREGKSVVQAIVRIELIKVLDDIAKKDLTSRSAIAGRIIEENVSKYIDKNESTD
jgi:hypothetical protein